MDNNYFTNVNPYFSQQDQGLSPVFQNIAQQQQNQNAALAQQNQLVQQAGQTGKQGGMNPMAMAMMLRKGEKPDQAAINAKDVQMGGLSTYNPFTQYSISQQYGTDPFSESSRMIAAQNAGMN
jgi:hypothetical protein